MVQWEGDFIDHLLEEVGEELRCAMKKHAPMHSAHEAFAVILEEVDEYKAEVWKQKLHKENAAKELLQIAAMSLRAIFDLELIDFT